MSVLFEPTNYKIQKKWPQEIHEVEKLTKEDLKTYYLPYSYSDKTRMTAIVSRIVLTVLRAWRLSKTAMASGF